jgi:1,4-dihydroxy-2-naphthoyl-CoA hydrolase
MEQNDVQRQPSQMRHLVGYRVVESSDKKVVAEIDYRADLTQSMGVWHTGAIITLADTAATGVAFQNMEPASDQSSPRQFPVAIQISANLLRNSNKGKLVAEAVPVHFGRRTIVVQTTVRNEEGHHLATVTSTMVPVSME